MPKMAPTYRPGEMDQRVDLQAEERTPDGQGGFTAAWVSQGSAWAHVRPLRGSEREHGDRIQAEGGYMVVIRYRADINETWRIVWNGRNMNIRFLQDEGPRALYLPMEVERGVAT